MLKDVEGLKVLFKKTGIKEPRGLKMYKHTETLGLLACIQECLWKNRIMYKTRYQC
jgi:hypothetical protein